MIVSSSRSLSSIRLNRATKYPESPVANCSCTLGHHVKGLGDEDTGAATACLVSLAEAAAACILPRDLLAWRGTTDVAETTRPRVAATTAFVVYSRSARARAREGEAGDKKTQRRTVNPFGASANVARDDDRTVFQPRYCWPVSPCTRPAAGRYRKQVSARDTFVRVGSDRR